MMLVVALVVVGVAFVLIVVLGLFYYHSRIAAQQDKSAPSSADTSLDSGSMKKDFYIHMNPNLKANGYVRAKEKLYGQLSVDGETTACMYQEPYKGPINNPAYCTLTTTSVSSDTPLKYHISFDGDESVDYAVPDMMQNRTPPPPFSELYAHTQPHPHAHPPPVPLSRPPPTLPTRSHGGPPILTIPPPPPKQEYYASSSLFQSSFIHGPSMLDAKHSDLI